MKVIVTREVFFADGPIGPLAEPTKMKIDSGGVKFTTEAGRRAFRPARAYVSALAFLYNVGGPVFSFRQRRQVDFPCRDCGRLPIHHEHALVSNQDGLGVKLAVNNGLWFGQQRRKPLIGARQFGQPGKASMQRAREDRKSVV